MKIVLFGSRGFLGQHFLSVYPNALRPPVDIANREAVKAILDEYHPDVVINAAGKTGRPNVDWCEDHKEETLHANVTGPLVLAEECGERGIYLVHLSSGCIYTGDKNGEGFTEDDAPNFAGSFYSRTKTWAEQMLVELSPQKNEKAGILILRLRMPFDGTSNDRNLLMKVSKFTRVNDVQNSLTYMPDFIRAADRLIQKKAIGIYNVVNPGAISPFEIIELYKEMIDPAHHAERVPMEELGQLSKAGRSNCVLSTSKLEKEGIHLLPIKEAVKLALSDMKNN